MQQLGFCCRFFLFRPFRVGSEAVTFILMISVLVAENRNLFTSKGHQGELEVSAEQSPSTFLCGSDGPSDSLFPCISLFSIERVPVRPRYQGYGRRQGNARVPRLLELLVIQSCISSFIQQVFFIIFSRKKKKNRNHPDDGFKKSKDWSQTGLVESCFCH